MEYETTVKILQKRLVEIGQEHLMRFWDQLDETQRNSLLSQIEAINFSQLAALTAGNASVLTTCIGLARLHAQGVLREPRSD